MSTQLNSSLPKKNGFVKRHYVFDFLKSLYFAQCKRALTNALTQGTMTEHTIGANVLKKLCFCY